MSANEATRKRSCDDTEDKNKRKRTDSCSSGNSDCVIEEEHITIITLDDTILELNNAINNANPKPTIVDNVEIPENNNKSLMKIIFKDKATFVKLKEIIIKTIKMSLKFENIHVDINENDDKNIIDIFEITKDGSTMDFSFVNEMDKESDLIFKIDRTPTLKSREEEKEGPEKQGPVYKIDKFKHVLTENSANEKIDEQPKRKRASILCFNCGEDHNLRDCKQPKDFNKINSAKQTHNAKFERYHIDAQQKFANFVPGTISYELRRALGLHRDEIPSHVYRMRNMGYPPGWLEDAKVSHSGLSLFDSKGAAIMSDDHEVGEIIEKEQFDVTKLIDFPGYNAPPPSTNFIDEYMKHQVSPMLPCHTKEAMISNLKDKMMTPYKRKKLKNLPGENVDENSEEELNVHDMDIEDFEVLDFCGPLLPPPLPDDDEEKPPPPPPADLEDGEITINDDELHLDSKSISMLERDKEKLENAIKSVSSDDCEVICIDDSIISLNNDNDVTSNNDADTLNSTTTEEPAIVELSQIKSDIKGTPLLKFSPFSQLPAGHNFSVGVSDVINFENLPDSTGKYDDMKSILEKVRSKMVKINDENERS